MLTVVLVDDEESDIQAMVSKLATCGNDIQIAALCKNVPDAVKAINTYQPDIVFTDIEMPGLSGLQLLDFFNADNVGFELIFTTSYSEHAVRAFQLSAIDYLLKPVDAGLLAKAVEKVRKKQNHQAKERTALLKQNLADHTLQRIAIPYAGGVNFIDINDIVYLKADNVYTDVSSLNGSVLTVSKPLKDFDAILPKPQFFRCHRSYVVNMQLVNEYITSAGGEMVMKTEVVVPLARDRKDEFLSHWKQIKL